MSLLTGSTARYSCWRYPEVNPSIGYFARNYQQIFTIGVNWMSNENFRGLLEGTLTHIGLYGYHKHQQQKKIQNRKRLSLLLHSPTHWAHRLWAFFIVCSLKGAIVSRTKNRRLANFRARDSKSSLTTRIFVDDQMLTISPFSWWGRGNVAQYSDIFPGVPEGKNMLHEARAVEVISFLEQAGECQRSETHA